MRFLIPKRRSPVFYEGTGIFCELYQEITGIAWMGEPVWEEINSGNYLIIR